MIDGRDRRVRGRRSAPAPARAARRRGSRRGAAPRTRRRSCAGTAGSLLAVAGHVRSARARSRSAAPRARPSGRPPGASSSRPTASAHRVLVREHERARRRAARGAPGGRAGRGPRPREQPAASARSIESARRNARSAASLWCHSTRTSWCVGERAPVARAASPTWSTAITCAPCFAIATAFSPRPQPRSSTRLLRMSPQSRRSASVGRSGPNCTTSVVWRARPPLRRRSRFSRIRRRVCVLAGLSRRVPVPATRRATTLGPVRPAPYVSQIRRRKEPTGVCRKTTVVPAGCSGDLLARGGRRARRVRWGRRR